MHSCQWRYFILRFFWTGNWSSINSWDLAGMEPLTLGQISTNGPSWYFWFKSTAINGHQTTIQDAPWEVHPWLVEGFQCWDPVFLLEPYAGHGTWDGRSFVDPKHKTADPEGKIAVLTRATIRMSRLMHFWKAVPKTADQLEANKGFIYSIGIGEIPFVKQATFSVWESIDDMKAFAYKKMAHQDVIRRTRKESWYSEEMFLRFKILRKTNHCNWVFFSWQKTGKLT